MLGIFSHYYQWIAEYSEKVTPPPTLIQANSFPLPKTAGKACEYLKAGIENAIVSSIDEAVPFTIETNALYHGIAALLNQSGRPAAFFLRTLSTSK